MVEMCYPYTACIKLLLKKSMFVSMRIITPVYFIIVCCIFFMCSCNSSAAPDEYSTYFHKDLSEQMDAISIAQGAVGDALRKNDFDGADWAYGKLDSIFTLMKGDINNHHSLLKPFDYYYKKNLKSPMKDIKAGIQKKDTTLAYTAYRILIARCNSCHNEHGVKERAHEY